MKKVFSSASGVAHAFALQNQYEGRNSARSFYFISDSLYSYGAHFCIAKFISEDTVLITERKYSSTTAKHVRHAWRALNHKNLVQCPYPDRPAYQNYEWWEREAKNLINLHAKARNKADRVFELYSLRLKVEQYSRHVDKPISDSLNELLAPFDGDAYDKARIETAERRKLLEERRQAKMKVEHDKQLLEFRNGTRNNVYARIGVDYVRRDVDTFVTSQGVRIPIAVGETFYRLLKVGKVSVGDKLDKYTVRSIDADSISIGCHTITMDEIENAINQVSSKTL